MQTPRGAVLHAGRMNHGADHQAQRVGHDMPLAAFDPFPGVEAPRAAAFGGFHALAVDNARRGAERWVIPPFLAGVSRRIYAAVFSFCAGVMPPMPMFGRSLLYVHSHCVAKSWASSMVSMMF
jgi:hypothetical protein